jgi:signal transduction histidine kinase
MRTVLRWWRSRSLRARLMIIGVSGLCAGFLLGGLALVTALGVVLQRSADAQATRTAQDVAALVDAGALPEPVPVTGADLVQVVDGSDRVRAASLEADRLVPMLYPAELARARGGEKLFVNGDRLGLAGPVRVVAKSAGPADDPQTVLVARSMGDAFRGVGAVRTILLIVFPLIVLALAAWAWRTIGATLRPVEELRRGAEEITGTDRSTRLPVPAGDDEIHRLATTLNGMLDRLEAGRARQRQFVSDAAHELRSPLANMRTQLEVAQRLDGSTDWAAVSADLLLDTERLSRLVDDLLLLARSDEVAAAARAEPVDVSKLVAEVAARYPSVTVAPSQGPRWTVAEPDGLRRVVANLLDNAVRHATSTVCVAVTGDGFTVTDDGPGIPEADRSRVFERFTRLDDARARDAGGAGLGLAIVRELVRRSGGTVSLGDAAPGLRVDVHLPAGAGDSGGVGHSRR